jgi:signal transduction histidine kinase
MGTPLRLLMVEDSEDDATFVLRALRRGGFDVTFERVDSAEAMRAALEKQPWELVLSDYHLPRFNALEAFAVLRERPRDLPFIIVSGTVGEEVAVEAMRMGVHDYILKGALTRLVPAVQRELREAAGRAERRKMQEELLISDRLASIGTLAAGVGHEINNPLAAVLANLDFSLQDLDSLEDELRASETNAVAERLTRRLSEVAGPLREAREAADRVRRIVGDLRLFSRAGDVEKNGPADVQAVLESSVRMAWNEIRHRARLIREYTPVGKVWANESRLGQVFLNLIINAAQSLPEGRSDENEIRVVIAPAPHPGAMEVCVRDTGTGIPADVLPRIFDPFFTTKPVGVGTGLGLAICRRIVTALGGQISVESEEGRGTAFRVILPLAGEREEEVADTTAPSEPEPQPAPVRRGKVLVIDDEPMICSVVSRLLGEAHDVVSAGSVKEALARLDEDAGFDVILCDLMMPDTTGMDLHAALLVSRPALARRIVFMTGGAFTTTGREFLDSIPNARVEKPFDGNALKALVASVVAR